MLYLRDEPRDDLIPPFGEQGGQAFRIQLRLQWHRGSCCRLLLSWLTRFNSSTGAFGALCGQAKTSHCYTLPRRGSAIKRIAVFALRCVERPII
jgi:hypothetical protein